MGSVFMKRNRFNRAILSGGLTAAGKVTTLRVNDV